MNRLGSGDIAMFFLSLGVLLTVAQVFAEAARRLRQPAVLGEMLAGILLGPTILGRLAPQAMDMIRPANPPLTFVFDGFINLAAALFLLVAGMEVDLSAVWRRGGTAASVAVGGIVVPFAVGLIAAWFFPGFVGREGDSDALVFALFFATAMSISALPVIARTLMDLGLYRTELGMIVIAAAIINDLLGWIIFAMILGMLGGRPGDHIGVGWTIVLTLAFTFFMLTVGRWMIDRKISWLHQRSSWRGGVLSFVLCLSLFGAAFTEWVGVHAVFGAFLVGVAAGDSSNLDEKTRSLIREFISFIFAPLFFASIGLKVDFIANFRWQEVLAVLLIACAGKILGCGAAARLSGVKPRESWAIAFGMNSRGAMEIILGLVALQYQVIRERTFVALVVMAIVTSMMSGPLMQRVLRGNREIQTV